MHSDSWAGVAYECCPPDIQANRRVIGRMDAFYAAAKLNSDSLANYVDRVKKLISDGEAEIAFLQPRIAWAEAQEGCGLKVLVTGRGTSGSWIIRGQELGTAIGATVEPNANNVKGYDLAVIVKRPRDDLLYRLRQRGVPICWDIVDAYPQPQALEWDRDHCLHWLRCQIATVQPVAIVAATQAMAADVAEVGFTGPVLALQHHARPGQRRNLVRERVQVVTYEGAEHYLGRWRQVLEQECAARGWRFVVNPPQLADADIVVALRESCGYAARHFKSGVKLANAQGSATPFIGNRESGYTETSSGAECFIDSPAELYAALDYLTPHHRRLEASQALFAAAPTLEHVAGVYRSWLEQLSKSSEPAGSRPTASPCYEP